MKKHLKWIPLTILAIFIVISIVGFCASFQNMGSYWNQRLGEPYNWAGVIASAAAACTALWVATKPKDKLDLLLTANITYFYGVDDADEKGEDRIKSIGMTMEINVVNIGNVSDVIMSWGVDKKGSIQENNPIKTGLYKTINPS